MGNTTRRILLVALASAPVAGLAIALLGPGAEADPRAARAGVATPAATAAAEPSSERAEATVEVSGSEPGSPRARSALASIATRALRRASTESAAADLEREILTRPAGGDLSKLRVRLERVLRDRPELAPGVARAFAKAEGRELAFVLGRALAVCPQDPTARAALEDAAAHGSADRREAALLALPPDAPTLGLARAAFDDASAAPEVRAAGVYTLARGWDGLGETDRAATAESARALAASPGSDPHLRAEAFHLLARAAAPASATADAALAARALEDTRAPAEVSLAAAHLALASGTDKAEVAAALGKSGERGCTLAASLLANPPPPERPSAWRNR